MRFSYDYVMSLPHVTKDCCLSDNQVCEYMQADLKDSLQKNQGVLADLVLFNSGIPFDMNDLAILGDGVSGSLYEATIYDENIHTIEFARADSAKIEHSALPNTIYGKAKRFYNARSTTIFGALQESTTTINPESATIKEAVDSDIALLEQEVPSTIDDALNQINEVLPSWEDVEYTLDGLPDPTEDIDGYVQQITSRGDLYVQIAQGEWEQFPVCDNYNEFVTRAHELFPDATEEGAIIATLQDMSVGLGIEVSPSDPVVDQLIAVGTMRRGALYTLNDQEIYLEHICGDKLGGFPKDFNSVLGEMEKLADTCGCQTVLLQAATIVSSGSATVGDFASSLTLDYSKFGSRAKDLVRTVTSFGSSGQDRVAHSLASAYKALHSKFNLNDDGSVTWGEAPVPGFDYSISSVFVGMIVKTAQIVSTILSFIPVTRIIGIVGVLISSVVSNIQNALATAVGTAPKLIYGTADNVVSVPLSQGKRILVSLLPSELVLKIRQLGAAKVINPFYVIYCFNYNDKEDSCEYRIFPRLGLTSMLNDFPVFGNLETDSFDHTPFDCYGVLDPVPENPGYMEITSMHSTGNFLNMKNGLETGDTFLGINKKIDLRECEANSNDAQYYTRLYNGLSAVCVYILSVLYAEAPSCVFDGNGGVDGSILLDKREDDPDHPSAWFDSNAVVNRGSGHFGVVCSDMTPIDVPGWICAGMLAMFGGSFASIPAAHISVRKYNPLLLSYGPSSGSFYQSVADVLILINHILAIDLNIAGIKRLFHDELNIYASWMFVDENYAVTLPTRSYQALLTAEILSVVTAVAAAVAVAVVAKGVKRIAEPWINTGVSKLESKRAEIQDDIDFIEKHKDEFPTSQVKQYMKALKAEQKALYASTRRFNLGASLLGMGGFDATAGFWDGPTTIGGTWGSSSDSGSTESIITTLNSELADFSAKLEGETEDDDFISLSDVYYAIVGKPSVGALRKSNKHKV